MLQHRCSSHYPLCCNTVAAPKTKPMPRKITTTIILLLMTIQIMAGSAGRPKVGLVLGGGGAKGAAEVGVLKVLEELDIPIDYIVGTSIGSIVGGLYACGYSANDLETLFREQEWLSLIGNRNIAFQNDILETHDGITYLFGFPIGGKKKPHFDDEYVEGFGLLRAEQVSYLLDSLTSEYNNIGDFDRLPIPFRCVAVDINSQEEVIMNGCELELAMRASMAIPGVFKPVKWDGHTLVDGGMLNNLPVDVVKQMGADIVIAIDLEQTQHKDRDFSLKETFGIGGILDWAISRPDWKKANENRNAADVYICPNLGKYGPESFNEKSIDDMIQLGERAARDHIKELKALKKKVKP